MRRSLRIFITLTIMAIFATGAYAFTASNTVDPSSAGYGDETISGFDVTDVRYGVDDTVSPPEINEVTFLLIPQIDPGGTVQVQLDGSSWHSCSTDPGSGYQVCPVSGVTVEDADNLEVLAYD